MLSSVLTVVAAAVVVASPPVDRNVNCDPGEIKSALPAEAERWATLVCTTTTQALLPQMGSGLTLWVHARTDEPISFEAIPRAVPLPQGFIEDVLKQAGRQGLGFHKLEYKVPTPGGAITPELMPILQEVFGQDAIKPSMTVGVLGAVSVINALEQRFMFVAEGDRLRFIMACVLNCDNPIPIAVLTGDEYKRRIAHKRK